MAAMTDVVEATTFWDCVQSLRRDDDYHADLMVSLLELRNQPFHNPKLQTHTVGKAANGKAVFSSDVGGRRSDRRLVWQKFGDTIVVLLYGTHAVQDRAKRMRIDFDPTDRVVTVFEQAPDTGVEQPYERQRIQIGRAFMAWTDDELRAFGFPDVVVVDLRLLEHQDDLLELADDLGPEFFEKAFNLLAHGHPDGEQEQPEQETADEPEVTDEDREIERQLKDERAGARFTRFEPEFLEEILGQPIEDWMVFLHPDQKVVVRKDYSGPARVRGAAGTGKTVVGLHRAAWLADQARERGEQPRILFTTFIKSLPPVFESLYLRMPGTRAGDVEFIHIDKLARGVCKAAGDNLVTAPREIDAAFAKAHKRLVYPNTPLYEAGFSREYLREEISSVIKGRGITDLDTYLEIERTGRRAPMGRNQRTHVWEVMEEWDAEMTRRGTVDFSDGIIQARDHARSRPDPMYTAAIIDEAQDLTLVGLQLVRALVNGAGGDRPNGLLLLGDGAQRIYPGGFSLRQAGVEVRGRTTVLKQNYRNTAEIIRTALTVGGASEIEDLDEHYRRGDADADTDRRGTPPELVEAADLDAQYDAVCARAYALAADKAIGPGDIGILVPTNRMVKAVGSRLDDAGLSWENLDHYDGRSNDKVKVGTYHRGKGLEFKAVLLPGLSKGSFPRPQQGDQSAPEAAEARELAISQLFVAMTRARDQLILFFDGEPSEVLGPHLDLFVLADA
jgi:hypothetical protein